MRHATLEAGGRDSAKAGEGGWASWTAQALFAWTRTHDEPGKSGMFGYIAAGLLCADVSFMHRALARFWAVGAKASHGNNRLLDACFRVFARCAKKRIFNSFTSFSRWKWFIIFVVEQSNGGAQTCLLRCYDVANHLCIGSTESASWSSSDPLDVIMHEQLPASGHEKRDTNDTCIVLSGPG